MPRELANGGVFRCLMSRPQARSAQEPVTTVVEALYEHYWHSGAHPEIVARLWDQLGKRLPADSRALAFGTPALVHRPSGLVLAFALGTEYAIRLPEDLLAGGRPAGLRTVARWSGGGSTDLERECGKEWIFGAFAAAEIQWCQRTFEECSAVHPPGE